MADAPFTDVVLAKGSDGIYDLVLDEANRDLGTTAGYDTALACSLFSDRRAAPDEVADPWKRRGWIGNLVPDVPGDNFGSGLWLYEQRRGTSDIIAAVAAEARTSLAWMQDANLVKGIDPVATYDARTRTMNLTVLMTSLLGSTSSHSFVLWTATGTGQLATTNG